MCGAQIQLGQRWIVGRTYKRDRVILVIIHQEAFAAGIYSHSSSDRMVRSAFIFVHGRNAEPCFVSQRNGCGLHPVSIFLLEDAVVIADPAGDVEMSAVGSQPWTGVEVNTVLELAFVGRCA